MPDGAGGQPSPRDPGLQPERTALAWNRTALAGLANAGLALRAGIVNDQWLVTTFGGILLVMAAAVAGFGALRVRQTATGQPVQAAQPVTMAATAAFACFTCATALAVVAGSR